MGRSSAEQARQNRARIVASASALFRARGIENVSLAEIMGAVGMTPGGFYKHFGSKEALAQEACTAAFAQAADIWKNLAEDGNSPATAAIVARYFRKRPAEQNCPILAYAPAVANAATDSSLRETYLDGLKNVYQAFLPDGTSQKPAKSEDEAAVLFAAMIGARLLAQATDNAEWSQRIQDAVSRKAEEMTAKGPAQP